MDNLKKQAIVNLREYISLLDELRIFHWFEGGTLLGAYRDKDFCPGDTDDIDIGCWASDIGKIPKIIASLSRTGWSLSGKWDCIGSNGKVLTSELAMIRGGSKVDLYFFVTTGIEVWTCFYDWTKGYIPVPIVYPKHFLDSFNPISLHGVISNSPGPLDEYFTYRYGDWRTPIHRRDYLGTNEKQNKAIRRDFVIP